MANVKFVIETDPTGAVTGIKAVTSAMRGIGTTAASSSNQATSAFDRMEKVFGKMRSAVTGFIGAVAFAHVIRGIREMMDAGIQFEASFAGIKKTVDGTTHQFEMLEGQMRDLAKEMPVAVNELNKIAEIGGQLGVPVSKLKEFTKTITQISIATNLTVEDAANGFAKFANLMGRPIDDVRALGSVIVDLGNKFVPTESEILAFSLNIAAAGRQAGLTAEQVAAFATGLGQAGLHAEKAGTAMSRILREMGVAVDTNNEKLKLFKQIAGESFATEFSAGGERAALAVIAFLDGLNRLEEAGENTNVTLEKLGLSEVRVSDVTIRLKNTVDTVKAAFEAQREATLKAGQALDTEYFKKLQTADSQLQIVSNRLYDVAVTISNQFKPTIVAAGQATADMAETIGALALKYESVIKAIAALGIGFAALKMLVWISQIKLVTTAVAALTLAFESTAGALYILELALAKFVIPAALIALAAILVEIKSNAQAVYDNNLKASKEEGEREKRIIALIEKYESVGMKIPKFEYRGKTWIEEISPFLPGLAIEFERLKKAQEENTAKMEAAKQASEEYLKALAKLKEQVIGNTSNSGVLADALTQLVRIGVPFKDIFAKIGDEITTTASALATMGMKIPSIIAAMRDAIPLMATIVGAANSDLLLGQIPPVRDYLMSRTARGSLTPSVAMPPPGMSSEDIEAYLNGKSLRQGGYRTEAEIDLKISAESEIKAFEHIEEVKKEMGRALDTLFDKLVVNGTLAWKDVGKFAAELFEDMAQTLMKPFRDLLVVPLSEAFSSLGKTLTESVTNLFGGSDGVQSKLGKLMSGVASAGIGAAISLGINMIGKLFAKSGSEVNNNLVKDIQNPFNEAVSKLMDSFDEMIMAGDMTLEKAVKARMELRGLYDDYVKNTGAYAAMGEKQQTAVRNAFATMEQYWGKDLQVLFDKIDGTIVELGGTAGMTMQEFEDFNQVLQDTEKFISDVKAVVDSVTDTSELDVMVAALHELQASGAPLAAILDTLGGDFVDLVDKMKLLGVEVPAVVGYFYDLFRALERIDEINEELDDLNKQLGDALIEKLDWLDEEIEKAQGRIADWTQDIADLNDEIHEAQVKLADAEYWQKRYTDGIRDAERAYEEAVDHRKDMQAEIIKLEKEITEAELKDIIKNSKNKTMIKASEKRLRDIELQEIQDKRNRVKELTAQLPEAIAKEKELFNQLELKKAQTMAQIEAEKALLRAQIEVAGEKRAKLYEMIEHEKAYIAQLEAERVKHVELMNSFGVSRQTEIDKINLTINALILRGQNLEAEKTALENLAGVTGTATGKFKELADLISNGFAIPSSINQDTGRQLVNTGSAGISAFQQGKTIMGFNSPFGQSMWPQAATGRAFVHNDGIMYVHKGEEIRTASQARQGSGSSNMTIQIDHVNINANDKDGGRDAAHAFVHTLETDPNLRRRLRRVVDVRK